MTPPPLSLALSLVLAAKVENAGRPALLATLHPEFGRTLAQRTDDPRPGLAQVIPLPRAPRPSSPRPARQSSSHAPQLEPDPSTAA